MTAIQTTLIVRLVKQLHWLEASLLTLLGVGLVLTLLQFETTSIITLSLSGLAIVFFLKAYQPPRHLPNENKEAFNFKTLLALAIIPKVLWISTATSTLGILLWLLQLENINIYKQMLTMGAATAFVSLFILGYFSATGLKDLRALAPVLLRAIPVLLLSMYVLST